LFTLIQAQFDKQAEYKSLVLAIEVACNDRVRGTNILQLIS